jgi:hypothetical protein
LIASGVLDEDHDAGFGRAAGGVRELQRLTRAILEPDRDGPLARVHVHDHGFDFWRCGFLVSRRRADHHPGARLEPGHDLVGCRVLGGR